MKHQTKLKQYKAKVKILRTYKETMTDEQFIVALKYIIRQVMED